MTELGELGFSQGFLNYLGNRLTLAANPSRMAAEATNMVSVTQLEIFVGTQNCSFSCQRTDCNVISPTNINHLQWLTRNGSGLYPIQASFWIHARAKWQIRLVHNRWVFVCSSLWNHSYVGLNDYYWAVLKALAGWRLHGIILPNILRILIIQ